MFFNINVILIALFGLAKIARAQTIVPSTDCTEYPLIHVTEYEVTGTTATYKLSADSTFNPAGTSFILGPARPGSSLSTVNLDATGLITLPAPTTCGTRTCYTVTKTYGVDVSNAIGFWFSTASASSTTIQFGSFSGGTITLGPGLSATTYQSFIIEQYSNPTNPTNHYAQTSASTCANQQWKHVSIVLAGGDPHIRTWNGLSYDFMGSCDLVLVKNAKLSNNDPLNIHIRTMLDKWWSYIESVALQIGESVLEINVGEGKMLVNGILSTEAQFDLKPGVTVEKHSHVDELNKALYFTYVVKENDTELLRVNGVDGMKQEMAVILHPLHPDTFADSVGMLGEYPSGRMLARDGQTVVMSPDDFGEIWKVDEEYDALLFSPKSGFPFPKCVFPPETLHAPIVSFEVASKQCKENELKDMCIQDVMSTGDLELVELYDEELSEL